MKKIQLVSFLFITIFGFSLLFSCSPKGEEKTDKPTYDSLSLALAQKEVEGVRADVDAIWALMEQKDMDKMNVLDTLMQHIGKTKGYNKAIYDSIPMLKQDLLAKKFGSDDLAATGKIDAYDDAMKKLLETTQRLVASTKGCASCEALLKYIQEADSQDLPRRQKYDNLVEDYNLFLEKKKGELEASGGKYAGLKPLPKFTIVEGKQQ